MRQLTINGRVIDDNSDPYMIAEIGHNHGGDISTAHELVRQAWGSGASAVKLQKRDNETLFTREMFDRPYTSQNSYGPTYGRHRMALELREEQLEAIQSQARQLGIDYFSTPFDITSADYLQSVDVPCFKIASADVTNTPLLRHVAAFGKPILISTGGADQIDVDRAVNLVYPINQQICILQCTASYPARYFELNLGVISAYRERYPELVVGYSGHDDGVDAAVMAYTLGARVIEKHFTLSRAGKGTDHPFSLEPSEFSRMMADIRLARTMIGDRRKRRLDSEREPIIKMAKSIYTTRPLLVGHVLRREDLAIKSPGGGLPPYELANAIGCRLTCDVGEEEMLIVEQLGEQVMPEVLAS